MPLLASNPVLAVIFFIGFLVFIHETGHFLIGRLCGIGVEIYSIGFGPRIFGFTHKGTDYQLCLLPLGGFVKFAGALRSEEVDDRFKGKEMFRASAAARAATILAGPMANLILAATIFTFHGLQGIQHPSALIGAVLAGGPADKAGMLPGDEVLKINGTEAKTWDDLRLQISKSAEKEVSLVIKRQDTELQLTVTPELAEAAEHDIESDSSSQRRGQIGISYGLVPAVVSPIIDPISKENQFDKSNILNGTSLAAGEQIRSISFPSGPASDSVKVSVEYWGDVLEGLERAYQAAPSAIVLELTATEQEDHESAPSRVLTFEPTAWQAKGFSEELAAISGQYSRRLKIAHAVGIGDSQLTIGGVENKDKTSLLQGDQILTVGGEKITNIFSLYKFFQNNQKEELAFLVFRKGNPLELTVALEPIEVQRPSGKHTFFKLGASFLGQAKSPPPYIEKYDSFFAALSYGLSETVEKSLMIVKAIGSLITGSLPLKALGGPMLIAKVAKDAAQAGWEVFFGTMAMISINLGMLNLFPIPALDGGQLLLVAAEGIRRKPLSDLALENFQRVGFVMIMALVVLATYNDLSRFWTSMLKSVAETFN